MINTAQTVKPESFQLLELVNFRLNREEFGIDILTVKEIMRMRQITRMPNSPDFIAGVTNIRGNIIPVVNLRSKMGLPEKEYDKGTRIIVVEVSGTITGFVVDAVTEVLRIPSNITEAPPKIVAGINSEYIKSVGKLDNRILILIDLEKVLSTTEILQLKEVA